MNGFSEEFFRQQIRDLQLELENEKKRNTIFDINNIKSCIANICIHKNSIIIEDDESYLRQINDVKIFKFYEVLIQDKDDNEKDSIILTEDEYAEQTQNYDEIDYLITDVIKVHEYLKINLKEEEFFPLTQAEIKKNLEEKKKWEEKSLKYGNYKTSREKILALLKSEIPEDSDIGFSPVYISKVLNLEFSELRKVLNELTQDNLIITSGATRGLKFKFNDLGGKND